MNEPVQRKPRRTIGMWLIAFLFAFSALLGGLRVVGAIDFREELTAVAAQINIPYLVISGSLTFLGGLVGVGSVFLRQFWVPKVILICASILSILYWFDQFCFVENTEAISMSWGFSLMVNVILLGFFAWVMTRRRVQAYYLRNPEE
ncbi:MAG: hypothetical protein V2J07_10520 [Anaerolineae bacterium]|jgi:hypothetical protein|nr:hypothetical protein [Anaerolineae bacterium]